MPTVLLINPAKRQAHPKAPRRRNSWDGGAVSRILNSSASRFFGERGGQSTMAKHRHRKARRNPANMKEVVPLVAGVIGGGLATRILPQTLLGGSNTGIMGYAANAAVAVVGAWATGKVNKTAGMGFLGGGLAALALRAYHDFTTGASSAGASDATMGLYIGANPNFSVPTYTTGNPLQAAPYNFGGGPTVLTAGGAPAAAAAINTTTPKGPYGARLTGRFSS
jgi:hypothetical protein